MARCKHEEIRVYVEVGYSGKLVNGVVTYDSSAPDHDEVKEVICLECDKAFDGATDEADTRITDAAPDLLAALELSREKYGRLHDFLSDCIEGGRLTRAEIPDDYQAIVEALCGCLGADAKAKAAIDKATKCTI